MVQERSLLADLVPRITTRREDVATDALAFILNDSPSCQDALVRLLQNADFHLELLTSFETQVTYDDGSRPDMLGYDQEGKKRLLVESKFWASLLQGQASGYFGQLEEAGPGVLMFIAPATRFETLWAEIWRQMESGKDGVQLESLEAPEEMRRARLKESDKQIVLVSWLMLLDRLAAAVPADSLVAANIQQLHGLAQREDDEAFLPMSLEELSPSLARRLRWFPNLVDDVVRHGKKEGWMSVKGLQAASDREGYGRYFRVIDEADNVVEGDLRLCVNYSWWANDGDTPLWLRQWSSDPISVATLRSHQRGVVEYGSNGFYVPIYLQTGVEYDRVLADAVRKVKNIAALAISV